MSEGEVRVRVAPSPTGDPHVGTAYQALFNYAFARGRGGKFVLRIEDTDRARSTKQSEEAILESLRWLGLPWDEGPDVGGPHGPYRQSERSEIYREHVNGLLKAGHAYRCFCTVERLGEMRAEQRAKGEMLGYDRLCRSVAAQESQKRANSRESFVVRMKVPVEGHCVIHDILHGEVHKDWASVDDQIILKSDGFPTYHLANVVDDHLMGITHVIRGEEWLNSVPKHLKLYEYFGWTPPLFCHLPLLRNEDKSKLSKRKNPTSIHYYRRAGYFPQALLNFLGMMGWLMPNGEEKFTLEEMCENLKLEDISLGGPVFDRQKLKWLNARYIREDYTDEALHEELERWAINREMNGRIVPLAHMRLQTLADWGYLTAAFFADEVPVNPEDLLMKGKTAEELAGIFQMTIWKLEELQDFSKGFLEILFQELAEKFEVKLKQFTMPYYVALSGRKAWTPLFDSMEVLGSDMTRMRLRRAIDLLGGISGKKLRKLENEYSAMFD
ncbi:MAG: glutamate--tRNA ligase [Candidatus Eisenbacteria sp.]|nr:glutamate--tRNA ligase [Candidatus Eisenbacteria bacterium]